jgi:NADH:ubiquinone oxidoreductase subunit E
LTLIKQVNDEEPWRQETQAAIKRYGTTRTSLISSLEAIQDTMSFIPEQAADYLSELYRLPVAEIYSVISFYKMLTTKRTGKYVIRICDSLSCHINQAHSLEKYIWGVLNIRQGETTPDGKFTLEVVDCLGFCDQAPAMMVNKSIYGKLNTSKLMNILRQLQEKG